MRTLEKTYRVDLIIREMPCEQPVFDGEAIAGYELIELYEEDMLEDLFTRFGRTFRHLFWAGARTLRPDTDYM